MTACSTSTTAAAAREVPLLLSCLHMRAAVSAPPADVQRALGVLRTLLSNRCERPAEPRYASFSATSTTWVRHVAPIAYVLRLATWMGCALDAEGSRYGFVDGAHQDGVSDTEGDAPVTAVLADRLHELDCVASAWSAATASESDASARAESTSDVVAQAARPALLELFSSVPASADRDAVWATYTRHLLLHRLLCCVQATDNAREGQPAPHQFIETLLSHEEASGGTDSWVARTRVELHRHAPGAAAADAFAACVATEPVRRLLARASLCDVHLLCDDVSATAGAAAAAASTATLPHASVVRSSFSASVANRLRERAEQEQQQRYLATTGPAYRRLCHEERHRGESVIVGIAGLLEELAVVRETQGLVRQDRQEARRLLAAFRHDGDLAKLYALEERYAAELEAAKELYGKPLVYAQPPDA